MNSRPEKPITRAERIFHAALFEILLMLFELLIFYLISYGGTTSAVLLVLAMSLTAMTWNFIFNWLFDVVYGQDRLARSLCQRIAHALLFELALVIFTTPMIVYALDMGWLESAISSAAISVFALIFAFVFNWTFDVARSRWVGPYPRNVVGAR